MSDLIAEVRERLKAAKRPLVLTGAGVSAPSGVPTFRGPDGLWRNYRAEELATPGAFSRDPSLVWEWYNWRRELLSKCEPNGAHYAIAELERRYSSGGGSGDGAFTLVTQNVDGLHRVGGSQNILELHGNIWQTRCTRCRTVSENRSVPIEILPYCESDLGGGNSCGGLLRPNIVWFGEALPKGVIAKTLEAVRETDFMIVAGTSGVVEPAASLASTASVAGAYVVEVNMEGTPISHVMDTTLMGSVDEILPSLIEY